METYRTDEEQVEALKKWWADNGKSTVLGIVVAVAAVFGWQGWQKQQEGKLAEASASYQSLLEADSAAETDSSKVTTAQHLAETLKADYPGTTYAIFGAMYKAKYAAQINKWEEAEAELRWVLDQKPNDPLLLQAKVRLAHVLLAQKRYEDAQNILAGSELGSYAALIAETRGDILMAQGDKAGALAAYEQAKTELAALENASQNPLLEMKINDLQSAQDGAAEE
ncbi:putative negative regulator of RcsB-dependent stress response [Litorivivens lipolytica]|uniref:Ancillary SecYEG translocon subunit n=1 Tax=Litorivivens lipolytica TaxID=1524264 RepID=A0A7W4W2Z5_9GAMM|nr:putative negative regulator of RcsB-dependent stress response [Litorivivens lipolytica]